MEEQEKPARRALLRVGSIAGTASFLLPAVAVGAAVAFVVSQYVPLVYDPSAISAAANTAEAAELKTVDTSDVEKESGEPTTGVNLSASDYGIDATNLKDGVYTGSGTGFNGTITVQVTVSGGKITAIDILSTADDEAYFGKARAIISSVIAAQSTSVDVISGATYSSKGILMAIKNALLQASGSSQTLDEALAPAVDNGNSNKSHATLNPVVPTNGFADGTYVGTGEGYRGEVRVRVTFAGGKMTNIEMLSNVDDPDFFNRAWSALPGKVVEKQTTAVDTVTGATYSSEGILGAVEDAMRQAAAAAGKTDPEPEPDPDPTPAPDPDPAPNPSTDAKYEDGEYTGYALCENEEDSGAFDPYYVAVTVTIADGKVSDIKEVYGTNSAPTLGEALSPFNDQNQDYLDWAAYGRTLRGKTYVGVVAQLLGGTGAGDIDVVTRSTYSSRAIAKAYARALEAAEAAYRKAHPSGSDSGDSGSSSGEEAGSEGSGETGSDSSGQDVSSGTAGSGDSGNQEGGADSSANGEAGSENTGAADGALESDGSQAANGADGESGAEEAAESEATNG